MIKHLDILIKGNLRHRAYALLTMIEAEKSGIRGFVCYTENNGLFIESEGENHEIDEFLTWCKNGIDNSDVIEISTAPGPLKNFKDFEIKSVESNNKY